MAELMIARGSKNHMSIKHAIVDKLSGEWRALPVIVVLLILWGIFYYQNPVFLSSRNLTNLSLQIVVTSVIALGLFFVLIIAELDLASAAISAITACITATLIVVYDFGMFAALLIGILSGTAIGLLQGLVINGFRAPAFIITLGSSLILQAALLVMLPDTNQISLVGYSLASVSTSFLPGALSYGLLAGGVAAFVGLRLKNYVGMRRHGVEARLGRQVLAPAVAILALGVVVVAVFNAYRGVPVAAALLFALLSGCSYVMRYTKFGTYLYAVGANREASRRAGIPVSAIRVAAFSLSATFAAIGGMLAASRVMGVSTDSASTSLLLEAIASAVIGGVSLFGGRGNVWSVLLGALVMGSIANGMLLTDASTPTRLAVQGAILIAAVVTDALLNRQSIRRR